MKELGQLYVAVNCTNCGKHDEGIPEGENSQRCNKCGRYATDAPEYCVTHDLDYEGLYPQDNHCPYCREEQRIQEQRMHEATRDPTMEPW